MSFVFWFGFLLLLFSLQDFFVFVRVGIVWQRPS